MDAREQFDRQAAHYNQQWADWNAASLEWLREHGHWERHDRVLDVATGTGYTALGLAPLVREVIGVDVSEGMLAQARAKGMANARFELGAAEALPFPDGAFDVVVSRIAPHHFTSVPAFVGEAHRVLKPGGRLLIADTTVPDDDAVTAGWQHQVETLRDPSHVRNYSPAEWRGLLAEKFTVEEMAVLTSQVKVELSDWLEKAGCTGTRAEEVKRLFAEAPEAARRHFQIEGESFAWLRVGLAARRL
jgi:ubiquinone/menaquinone biosynthesis C-methylase UbiE